MSKKILIFFVEDNPVYLKAMEHNFTNNADYELASFTNGEDCLKEMNRKPSIVFLDYFLDVRGDSAAMNGLQVLQKIKELNPETEVVMLSGQDNMEVAVNCLRHGAFDYIVKSETAFVKAKHAVAHILHSRRLEFFKKLTFISIGFIIVVVVVTLIIQFFYPHLMNM